MVDPGLQTIIAVIDERATHGWLIIDTKLCVMYANKWLCTKWQKDRAEISGKSIAELTCGEKKPDGLEGCLRYLTETIENGREFVNAEFSHEAGPVYSWYLVNTYLVQDAAGNVQYALGSYMPVNKLQAIEGKLDSMHMGIIRAFCKAAETRDMSMRNHSESVAELMAGFAAFMGMQDTDAAFAYLAGIAHDIGKIGIPEHILNKPGKLSEDEYRVIKEHSRIGAEILEEIEGFSDIAVIIRHHHERYVGGGYPLGLQGEEIPLVSRMLSLCDSYDAMTADRVYRRSLTIADALKEIEACAGKQFDPVLSRIFIRFVRRTILRADAV